MDIPDNPRNITEPQRCPRCEYTWDALGLHEHGNWNPYNEDDLICDECGKNLMEEENMKKPKIIVLCGSSRFVDIMAVTAWLLERDEQAIAMGLHLLPQWYLSPSNELPDDHLAEHEGVADAMDALHMRKIDLADEIFVINVKDYIGESTSNEIAYAKEKGLPIRWFTHDSIGKKVEAIGLASLKKEQATP